MLDTDYALLPPPEGDSREVDIEVDADVAVLRNGKMHWLAQPEWRREGANRTGLHGLRIERRYARLDVLRAVER